VHYGRRSRVRGVQCPAGPFAHFRPMDADAEKVAEKPTRKSVRREATTTWRRLVSYMFEPEDGECLAALRMAFGEFNAYIVWVHRNSNITMMYGIIIGFGWSADLRPAVICVRNMRILSVLNINIGNIILLYF